MLIDRVGGLAPRLAGPGRLHRGRGRGRGPIAAACRADDTLPAKLPALIILETELLLEQISAECQATVDQLTVWLSSEEQRLSGLLEDVRQTLATGNMLVNAIDKTVGALDTFMEQLKPAELETPKPPGRPFGIREHINFRRHRMRQTVMAHF